MNPNKITEPQERWNDPFKSSLALRPYANIDVDV
jgi:hypothetical protein